MSVPQVTCGVDALFNYGPGQNVALSAVATGAPILAWTWTILYYPPGGAAALDGGDFVAGVATVQNPHLVIPPNVAGSYVVQCVATNADGNSDPEVDLEDAQQVVLMRTQLLGLEVPGGHEFDWAGYLNQGVLEKLEAAATAGRDLDLQGAYENWSGAAPALQLDAVRGGLAVDDALAPLGTLLLGVRAHGGATEHLGVYAGETRVARAGVLQTAVPGFTVRNPTPATGADQLQLSPALKLSGTEWVGGASSAVSAYLQAGGSPTLHALAPGYYATARLSVHREAVEGVGDPLPVFEFGAGGTTTAGFFGLLAQTFVGGRVNVTGAAGELLLSGGQSFDDFGGGCAVWGGQGVDAAHHGDLSLGISYTNRVLLGAVAIPLHLQGEVATDLTFTGDLAHLLSVADAPANTAGYDLTLRAGAATGPSSGAGGDNFLLGGAGVGAGGLGGHAYVRGGAGTTLGNVYLGDADTAWVYVGAATKYVGVLGLVNTDVTFNPGATRYLQVGNAAGGIGTGLVVAAGAGYQSGGDWEGADLALRGGAPGGAGAYGNIVLADLGGLVRVTGLGNDLLVATTGSGYLTTTAPTGDVLTQYALLAGRSGGQTLKGGTAETDYLKLVSTAGTGTTDYIALCVGTNGGTEGLRVIHDGKVGIGEVAPSQALDLIGSLELQTTISSTTGVIYKGADRFIHNFRNMTGGPGGGPNDGSNTFLGLNAGNFTMGGVAGTYLGSGNTGFGVNALAGLTTGFYNAAFGWGALASNQAGYYNTAIGVNALLQSTTGNVNVAIGFNTLFSNIGGYGNMALGSESLYHNTGSTNVGVGWQTLYVNVGGSGNVAIGCQAAYNETGSNKLYIANSNTATPLIYGDFATGKLKFHSIGGATADTDVLTLENLSNAASMVNTRTSILFNQWYYDAGTPAVADAGKVTVGTETNWTSTASTQDAYMAFSVALNGTVYECGRFESGGWLKLNASTTPQTALLLDIAAIGGAGERNSHALTWKAWSYVAADKAHVWTADVGVSSSTAINSLWRLGLSYDGGAVDYALQVGYKDADPKGVVALASTVNWTLAPLERADDGSGRDLHVQAGKLHTSGSHGIAYFGDANTSAVFLAASAVLTTISGTLSLAGIGTGAGDYPLKFTDSGDLVTYDTSDARQKHSIGDLRNALATVRALRPVSYVKRDSHRVDGRWVENDPALDREEIGFLAQEVYGVEPLAAVRPQDEATGWWGLRDRALLALSTGAIRELAADLDGWRAKVETREEELTRRVAELEADVRALRAA